MRVITTHRAINPLATFNMLDSLMDEFFNGASNSKSSLGSIIKRPYNLLTEKDKDGDVSKYVLEVVYTPFKKDDVTISIEDNVLHFKCEGKSEQKDSNEEIVYRGISSQGFNFALPFVEDIDIEKIDAKAEDGIVRIVFPVAEKAKPVRKSIKLK
jgi:HSP20 family protein